MLRGGEERGLQRSLHVDPRASLRELALEPVDEAGEADLPSASTLKAELSAELDAMGISHIRETAFPGVWWLEHRNTEGEVVGRYIEVTRTPEILMSQDADILAGRARLGDTLEAKEAQQ